MIGRMIGRLMGRGSDLITILMTRRKDGLYEVQDIGDDAGAPKKPPAAPTISDLRRAIDPALVAHYGPKLPEAGMGVGYAIYPWRQAKVPKALAKEIGTDFFVFGVDEADGRFRATEMHTTVTTSADSLDALTDAVRETIAIRWPALAPEVPGMLNWQRWLTKDGFASYRP